MRAISRSFERVKANTLRFFQWSRYAWVLRSGADSSAHPTAPTLSLRKRPAAAISTKPMRVVSWQSLYNRVSRVHVLNSPRLCPIDSTRFPSGRPGDFVREQ